MQEQNPALLQNKVSQDKEADWSHGLSAQRLESCEGGALVKEHCRCLLLPDGALSLAHFQHDKIHITHLFNGRPHQLIGLETMPSYLQVFTIRWSTLTTNYVI